MTNKEAKEIIKSECYVFNPLNFDRSTRINTALDMAIKALEMQKKLAEFSGMDICNWVEDYDFEENNISEYEYEASVDNFLIDEVEEDGEEEGDE